MYAQRNSCSLKILNYYNNFQKYFFDSFISITIYPRNFCKSKRLSRTKFTLEVSHDVVLLILSIYLSHRLIIDKVITFLYCLIKYYFY